MENKHRPVGKLLMEYDDIRDKTIKDFIKIHEESNGICKFLSEENKTKLHELKFNMSDVWVLTDEEYEKLRGLKNEGNN